MQTEQANFADHLFSIVSRNSNIHIYDLFSIGCTSKSLNKQATGEIKFYQQLYISDPNKLEWMFEDTGKVQNMFIPKNKDTPLCSKCKTNISTCIDGFREITVCDDCKTKCVSLTEARKTYKLTDDELSWLNYTEYYQRMYRKLITLYDLRDIRMLSFLKHGKIKPDIVKRDGNKARDKREEQLSKTLEQLSLTDNADIKSYSIVRRFLENGDQGVRKLKANLSKFVVFKEKLGDLYDTYKSELFDEYIESGDIVIQNERSKGDRRSALVAKLGEYNLTLRCDSRVCDNFINNNTGGNIGDINEVVRIMREMDWFYTKTNYPRVYKYYLDDEYREAKKIIRDSYGIIRDPDEYEEILDEYVDRDRISRKAKLKILRIVKNVPEFVIV